MDDDTKLMNPFSAWGESVRDLRDRFMAVLDEAHKAGTPGILSPRAGDLLGMMAGMANDCDRFGIALQEARAKEPAVFDAFVRAMETSTDAA
jgi:hypothetical protein